MTQKAVPTRRKKIMRRTATHGKRVHIFLDEAEQLVVHQYKDARGLSFSAAAGHLILAGRRAEELQDSGIAIAVASLEQTVASIAASVSSMQDDVQDGQRLMSLHFEGVQKSAAGAYLASRMMLAKHDPAQFDRLDPMLKTFLEKLMSDRDSPVANPDFPRGKTNGAGAHQ